MPEKKRTYINGEWRTTEEYEENINPYNGEVIGYIPIASEKDVEDAIQSAVDAFKTTKKLSAYEKSKILENIKKGIEERKEELARMIVEESGKPWQYALGEVNRATVTFTFAAEEAKRIGGEVFPVDIQENTKNYRGFYKRFPLGPIIAITPYNFPLNLVAHKIAPAIAAGNSVVLKPPPQAPFTSLILAEIIEKAGAPAGMVNVVPTTVERAEKMVRDERFKLLSFTGSPRVGWYLKNIAGKKKILLELGGNAGAVVDESANLDFTAWRLAIGGFANAGQICIAVQRIYVHKNIYDKFLEKFKREVEKLKIGDPMDPDTVFGPLIDERAADKVERWISDAIENGAIIITGAKRRGNIIEATIISDVKKDLPVYCEEVFGPVVITEPFDAFEEAIDKVNDSQYGLQAGIFTNDLKNTHYAIENLDVGGVIINDYPTFRVDNMPYGGIKDSGLGREGLKYAVEEMTEIKTVIMRF